MDATLKNGNKEGFITLLIKSLLAIGLGLAFLLNPHGMITTFSYLIGIVLIVYGLLELFKGIKTRKVIRFGNLIIEDGLMNMLVGSILVFWPDLGPNLVMILLGSWFVLGGIIQLVIANKFKDKITGRNIRGFLTVILGAIIIFNPSDSVRFLSMFIGGVCLIVGLYLLVIIFRLGKSK
jgi:uncharacterized membrane protein HdeD (DUF308 family)